MIDSPTVTTEHNDGVDAGPSVTLPSDIGPGPALTDRARLLATLDGLDAAGSVPVGWLVSLLRRLGSDPTIELAFDGTIASMPPKAMTLRSVAHRCGRSPGTVGAWQRIWRELGLIESGPPPTVDVARLRAACDGNLVPAPDLGPSPSDSGDEASGSEGDKLDVLLRHLRLAAAAGEDAAVDVITGLAHRLVEATARETARPSGNQNTDREIEKSLDSLSLSSIVRDARPPARSIARSSSSRAGRSTAATLKLLAPLLETVDRFSLAPLTDGETLAQALRPYNDDQVLHAQSVLLRQCNTQRNITSPIGLLVRHAQQQSPEYFELPTSAPAPTPEPRPPDDQRPSLCPEQRAAAAARARSELAKADRQHRRPVHRAKGHAAQ